MTDYVYPGYVRSRTDGDRHFIGAAALMQLYGLNPHTTKIVGDRSDHRGRRDDPEDRHFYPRDDGKYERVST